MDLKPDIIYSTGRSKYVAPSHMIIKTFDDDWDPEYVPQGTRTPTLTARATIETLKRWLPG